MKAASILIQKSIFTFNYSIARLGCSDEIYQAVARNRNHQDAENCPWLACKKEIYLGLQKRFYYSMRYNYLTVAVRRYFARRRRLEMGTLDAAVKIQSVWRSYVVRKEYKANVKRVVLIQSSMRRRLAMNQLKGLKIEAKSIGKLKATNYALENKLIELSQSVLAKEQEKKALLERVTHLESQASIWKEKFGALDSKTRNMAGQVNEDTSILKKEILEIQNSRDALIKEGEKNVALLRKKDDDLAISEARFKTAEEELKKVREQLKNAPKKEDEGTIAALKKEVTSLRDQMGKMIAGKWKSDRPPGGENFESSYYNNFSPSPIAGSRSAYPSDPFADRGHSVTRTPIHDNPPGSELVHGEVTFNLTKRSLRILEDKALEEEIIDSLITNLRIPLPSTQTVASQREILFPSHLIGSIMSELLLNGMTTKMQSMMSNVMKAVQTLTLKFEDDYVSAFWLSNCFELLCIVRSLHKKEQLQKNPDDAQFTEASDIERTLEKVRSDLDYLLIEIYHGWIKELKKRLANMIVPAVIENQSLPGYICNQSAGIWVKWAKTATVSQFTIEQLLNFLSKLNKTMRCYYMDESMTRQILTELLRVIGVSSFNHILMRKNFLTWKRGVQITYNISRLEEWCTTHLISEAGLHLQQLLQASKLLTLNKTSPQDIEAIFDVCFLLNPTQIKKLLSLYYAADFDSPVFLINLVIS